MTRTTRSVSGTATTRAAARTEAPVAPAPGEYVALVGPSGSGKSTVLHALAGFLRPASGSVSVVLPGRGDSNPGDLSAEELAGAIAWVPQWASSTIAARTVLDEVLLTSRVLGIADGDLQARALGLLDALGLAALRDADPRTLSGGELRRLAVAAAVLHGPRVVLADEPTVGQDRHTWAAVVGILAAYREAGGSIVAATHDEAVISRAAHTLVLRAPPAAPAAADGRPWLGGRGPLALFAGSALAIPVGILSPAWRTSLWLLGLQLALAVGGLVPWSRPALALPALRALAIRAVPGALAALSVGWSTWLLGGHRLDGALTGFLRVLLIVLPSVVLLPFVDTDRLGDQLAQSLRLPDRPVVATAAALHRMQSFTDLWTEIGRVRRVRGLSSSWRNPGAIVRHIAALTLGLLIRALRSAADLAVAMDARGFATAHRRTWWGSARWSASDVVVVVAAALPAILAGSGILVSR